jgi:hypothetical protein
MAKPLPALLFSGCWGTGRRNLEHRRKRPDKPVRRVTLQGPRRPGPLLPDQAPRRRVFLRVSAPGLAAFPAVDHRSAVMGSSRRLAAAAPAR